MQAQINNISLHYTDSGNADGVPVIFIHGFPFDHTMWDEQVAALPSRFRAVTFDMRGHGQSEVGSGQYFLEFFVDDLLGLMDHLSIDKAIWVGLSMGGYTALRAIEKAPERCKGLVLCDTRSEPDTNEAKLKRATALKNLKTDGLKAYAENSVKNLFWSENLERKPQAVEKVKNIIEATSMLGIGGTLLALASRTDTTHVLQGIKVPTLILVGEHDAITPPIAAQSMHESIEGSVMEVIPDAAHLSNLENPTVFNQHLLKFLERY
jgi:3-oxoadipate enol-lactonase